MGEDQMSKIQRTVAHHRVNHGVPCQRPLQAVHHDLDHESREVAAEIWLSKANVLIENRGYHVRASPYPCHAPFRDFSRRGSDRLGIRYRALDCRLVHPKAALFRPDLDSRLGNRQRSLRVARLGCQLEPSVHEGVHAEKDQRCHGYSGMRTRWLFPQPRSVCGHCRRKAVRGRSAQAIDLSASESAYPHRTWSRGIARP